MSASTVYISASVNRYNHAAACTTTSLVAYGSGNLVALWDAADPSEQGVHQTLAGHTSRVTCVDLIDDKHLISADDSGTVKIWHSSKVQQWSEIISLRAHTKSITALAYYAASGLLLTGSSDASITVWSCDQVSKELSKFQTITLKNRYPLSIALTALPDSTTIILAVGCTDRSVQVYTRSAEQFVHATSLPGHEDWIRALAFLPPTAPSTPLILASGSQDATIRLWNIEPLAAAKTESNANADELLDAFEASLGETGERDEGGRQITLKRHIVRTGDAQYSITFDALLVGHEAGVTSLAWRPASSETTTPTLLSSSTDSSLSLWSPAAVPTLQQGQETSLWISRERFGDIGGQRLGGFVGALWVTQGKEVLGWGWAGGCRRWRVASMSASVESEKWTEVGAISGHAGPVRGISWAPSGEYLFSVGVDQTTRVHGAIPTLAGGTAWHELARPQVHGYDLVGVATLSALSFVSIADEKVARAFEASSGFVKTVRALGVAKLEGADEEKMPASAVVPPLGLSNKANSDASSQVVPVSQDNLTRRPFEGELASATLWPETEKIFGHGYESISLACSSSRALIATACKATTAQHAVVRVYDASSTFKPVGRPLEGHSLTVTRITFSPDDTRVLSVSRDRTWHLSERQEDGGYVPVAADKSHTRIIWDCAWAPEGDTFATASRDKTVRVWRSKDDGSKKWSSIATLKLDEAATAVAFAPGEKERRVLAVGLETGEILLYASPMADVTEWKKLLTIPRGVAHIDHINQLAWRPLGNSGENEGKLLASCSDDGTLRVLRVNV
ncbi:WD40 repeat-like protein [Peniophora sp. CONT]|nr:WD40 repeat-like protein [Peniophora sp. CONT]